MYGLPTKAQRRTFPVRKSGQKNESENEFLNSDRTNQNEFFDRRKIR
jgi:hypothetical protein